MKKYQKPTMKVERIQHQCHLLEGTVTKVDGNGELDFGGKGYGPARSRQHDGWDDCD